MKRAGFAFLIFSLLTPALPVWSASSPKIPAQTVLESVRNTDETESVALPNARTIQQKNEAALLAERHFMDAARRRITPAQKAAVKLEAGYILSSQFVSDPSSAAYGAINNVAGDPTWIVPRENALAILGLLQAAETLKDPSYRERAELAASYLISVQDVDGGWFDQYSWTDPTVVTKSKSPTQTAEVMMALDKLGYSPERWAAMKKGADFLLKMQDPAVKGGADDGLIGGGIQADGVTYHTWRWASDNSFAYLALKDAAEWAKRAGDKKLAKKYDSSAERILDGINRVLYVSDRNDPDFGVWRRAIDENGVPQETQYREWINYAPQMLDLPARGVGNKRVGEWIHKYLQKEDGSVVWDNGGPNSDRQSPGFSFQASLVWLDLGQKKYADLAVQWAVNSGLLQLMPDEHGVTGGWIDWIENGTPAPEWQRFIDTSFYATSVFLGGYDFRD